MRLHSGPLEVSAPIDAAPLLAAAGLSAEDLAGPPPRLASAGLPFAYLMVRPGSIDRVRPDLARLRALPGGATGVSVFEVAGNPAEELAVRARVLADDVGRGPGDRLWPRSASRRSWLLPESLPEQGDTRYVIRQGEQIGRPSRLECEVSVRAGAAVRSSVRGRSVLVSTGRIAVPSMEQIA